jgi:phospholipase/carboxylesterase
VTAVPDPQLLIVLHGHDSSPEDAGALARQIDPDARFAHVAPEGPYDTVGGGREWFSDTAGSLARTQIVLSSLFAELAATGPVVVVGYSQGAAAALATLTSPGAPSVKAVACVSGYLGEEPGLDHNLGRLAGTTVLVQHGRQDDVVPDFLARDLVTALEAAAVDVTAQWFEMGHERTVESLAALTEWLVQQEEP